ncbi:MAG: beta-propeller fold lactonase family protein, partial [Candidatus Omnitrophica bacterium]|nr:beta-propeller fold lactonase family protein [Candidatus Omnitrophota bacterium]
FYETKRYSHLFDSITKGTISQDYPEWDLRVVDRDKPYLPYINKNDSTIFTRFGGALLTIIFFIASAFAILLFQRKSKLTAFHGSYQILTGAGYLILETLFLQIYQEHFRSPAIAFVIILTTLLITSATGGYTISRRLTPSLALLGTFLSLIIHAGLHAGGLDAISSQVLKILIILLTVGMSGFFMGYFLPFGLNAARTSGHTDKHLANLFALNSLAGAATPILVLFLSSHISLSFSLWTAATLYAIASLIAYSFNDDRKNSPGSVSHKHLSVLLLLFSIFTVIASYNSSNGSFFYKKKQTATVKKEILNKRIETKTTPTQIQHIEDKPARALKQPSINHPKSILLSPNGKRAYIQNLYTHTVNVVDTASLEIIKVIPLKGRACEATITPDGRWLWVSVAALEDDKGTYPKYIPEPTPGWETYNFPSIVNLIDTTQDNGTVIAEVPVDVKPKIVRLSPNGKFLLVSNFNSGTISVINTKSRKVIKTIKVGRLPRGICFSLDGKYAYIANMGSREITCIDMKQLEVIRSLTMPAIPRHLVTSPDGKFIYYSDASRQGHLIKIDSMTGVEIGRAKTGEISRTFVLSSDGKKAFVGNYSSADVTIINTAFMTPIGRIKTLPQPIGLALSPDDKELWVSSFTKSSISIYNVNEL